MSIYGEGKYLCQNCGPVFPGLRSEAQLRSRDWELNCPECGRKVAPAPTDESKPLQPTAVYSMTKRHQEELCLLIGKTYGISTVALRFFNVYGPRQTLSNPYTGVGAIFTSRILSGKPPHVFEDGGQRRDFVHVRDVANAIWMVLERRTADFRVYNVGSGSSTSIKELAEHLLRIHKSRLRPFISNSYRKGDTRHCFGDITKIRNDLGFSPTVSLEKGLVELAGWSRLQTGVQDRSGEAKEELERHGLVSG
jgi:dTDP-L-rhamnose 4-epimerase